MALSLNKVTLMGRIGKDPEFLEIQGKQAAKFSLATSKHFQDKQTQEWKSNTEWHSIFVMNDHLVDYINRYIKKGMHVYVEGEIKYKEYTNKEGVKLYSTSINVGAFNGVVKLVVHEKDDGESKGQTAPAQQYRPAQQTQQGARSTSNIDYNSPIVDDEIPF